MAIPSVGDFRLAAKRRLPRFLFEYIDGGSYDERTLHRNVSDLARISLRQRVLRDVSNIDLATTLFGKTLSLPLALGPIGLSGMYARRGEVQAARAAAKFGIPFCLSTVSVCPIAEVRAAAPEPFWFQLYMIRDRGFMRDLLDKADEAGCDVLLFTVDMPQPGARYRDYRSGLAGAAGVRGALRRSAQAAVRPRWAWNVGLRGRPHVLGNVVPVLGGNSGMEDFFAWMATNFDPSVSWKDLDWVRERWTGKLMIKGILDPADARSAAALGADGVVVSNHGGRQLDGVVSTVRALPRIVQAVGEQMPVLVDGGVRSGLDVVRMLSLGAKAVLLGRAWAWALAAGGENGVSLVLEIIRKEMSLAMALTGHTRLDELSGDAIDDVAV